MASMLIGRLSYKSDNVPHTVTYVAWAEARRIMHELIASHSMKVVYNSIEHTYYFAPCVSIDTWKGVISITIHNAEGVHHTVGYDVTISPELQEWHQLICLGIPAGWL